MPVKATTTRKSTQAKTVKKVTARRPVASKSRVAKKAVIVKKPVVKAVAKKPVLKADTGKKPKKAKKAESKVKVIRDSFTMPQSDYAKISELKQLCQKSGLRVKKSELLRAGLHALSKLNAAQLKLSLTALEKIKTGRPKKHK